MKKIITLILLTILFSSFNIGNHTKKISKNSQDSTIKIDTSLIIEIGGIKQFLEIKTDDSTKPVLLFLAGGPGGSMINSAAQYTNKLKDKFTIIQWDQRGAGKTLELNPPQSPPSTTQMQNDTYEVIEFLTKKLKKKKISLAGFSSGNILGFYIVEKHPEVLYSYLAINPVVNQMESEKLLLIRLKEVYKNNEIAQKELSAVKIPFETQEDLFFLRKWFFDMDRKNYAATDKFKAFFLKWTKTWFPAWQELMEINLPKTLVEVKRPVYFFVGKDDIQTSTQITEDYFKNLKAPKKELFLFEYSKHSIQETESKKFQNIIIENILSKDPNE